MSKDVVDELLKNALQTAHDKGYQQGVSDTKDEFIRRFNQLVKSLQSDNDSRLDIPIEDLGLSERARNCLRRFQIDTIGELIKRNSVDLQRLPNFGMSSLKEVETKLAVYGLKLADR